MKKVTVFVGCASKRHTLRGVEQFLAGLKALGDVECETVILSDHSLMTCRGCRLCCDKGEELCPLHDDRDKLLAKMEASNGVVFATPNYMFQVSGYMKVFLDRLGFLGHRPRFHGKAFTAIVTQGIMGGNTILKYLDFVGKVLGFNTVKGKCLQTLVPIPRNTGLRNDRALAILSRRFYRKMTEPPFPEPGLLALMVFRMSRTKIRLELESTNRDYMYFAEKGWFQSDFYYPTSLGTPKKLVGSIFDTLAAGLTHVTC